jgi:hypothetical protein
MSRVAMVFTRGEDFVFGVDVQIGDPADIASIAANAKRAAPGLTVPSPDVSEAFDWLITPRAASGGVGAGWNLSLSHTVTADLAPGTYCTTIDKFYTSGAVHSEPTFFFRIEEST